LSSSAHSARPSSMLGALTYPTAGHAVAVGPRSALGLAAQCGGLSLGPPARIDPLRVFKRWCHCRLVLGLSNPYTDYWGSLQFAIPAASSRTFTHSLCSPTSRWPRFARRPAHQFISAPADVADHCGPDTVATLNLGVPFGILSLMAYP